MAEFERTTDGRPVEVKRQSATGWIVAILIIAALVVAAFAFGLIDIDQTKETKLPDVSISTTDGQAPAFDVDTAKVDVGTKEQSIDVPTVKVDTKKTDITLPTIDVDRADNPNKND